MQKISEFLNEEFSSAGASCSVFGRFYYRISEGEISNGTSNCYLAESDEEGSPKLFFLNDVGESVIDNDETFGMMVGGEFAYFGIYAEVTGLIKRSPDALTFEVVDELKLEKDGDIQVFKF